MANPNPQLEAALAQFAAQPGTTPAQEAQLRAAVIADADRFNRQATSGQLKGFALEAPGGSSNLTGRYDKPVWTVRTSTARWLALLCVLLLSACATAAERHPPAKETTTMHPVAPTQNPKLSAEEIGKRFLKLIEGLSSREDLSLVQVQDTVGIRLAPAVHGGFYGAEGDVGDGWKYVLNFYAESRSNRAGVQLHFVQQNERFGDMGPVCKLDFDDYHRALKAMGFVDNPTYGEIGQLEDWRYAKFKASDGSVDFEISIIPQNVVAGGAGRLCVKSIGTLNGR
ncbi:hypothetical protein [Xanthomonas fragariae]|uniref:hypothetical protein n=1 Tax=Xanthomonas fragariae TaxID=48664 RepID=UPI0022AB1594|nr:hypothetical protein [Xanthomonas fragariae]WAT16324.1 hypothetical protein OZ429_08785 [Xanthomonas fragariae]